MVLYPLRFLPSFRRYLWGGRRLGTVLGKRLPPGEDYAESWEIVDHGEDQSEVAFGPLAGTTLHELVIRYRTELFGTNVDSQGWSGFPLLFKFLDACQDLSIQVHPNDVQGAQLPKPDAGKTEAWVVLATDPGSRLYAGLRAGTRRADLERHLHSGTILEVMHVIEPQAGDCIFIPAGVVHAIGKGLLIAEIQQASDTTFRLYDWGRVGPDGKPRATHIPQALAVTDFSIGPISPQIPSAGATRNHQTLVACDKFVLERWIPQTKDIIMSLTRFQILAVVAGELTIAGDPSGLPVCRGETVLIPGSLPSLGVQAVAGTEVLTMALPPP
jgi:mannose-6-phosphate isomerase